MNLPSEGTAWRDALPMLGETVKELAGTRDSGDEIELDLSGQEGASLLQACVRIGPPGDEPATIPAEQAARPPCNRAT